MFRTIKIANKYFHIELPSHTKRNKCLKLQAELATTLKEAPLCRVRRQDQQRLIKSIDIYPELPNIRVILKLLNKYHTTPELFKRLLRIANQYFHIEILTFNPQSRHQKYCQASPATPPYEFSWDPFTRQIEGVEITTVEKTSKDTLFAAKFTLERKDFEFSYLNSRNKKLYHT